MPLNQILQKDYTLSSLYYQIKLPLDLEILIPADDPVRLLSAFVEGMECLGHQIKGFDRPDAVLSGIESRTSSPVRILRDESFQSKVRGLYPCGEGAGYAGGITSAAMDGIRAAEAIASVYGPIQIPTSV